MSESNSNSKSGVVSTSNSQRGQQQQQQQQLGMRRCFSNMEASTGLSRGSSFSFHSSTRTHKRTRSLPSATFDFLQGGASASKRRRLGGNNNSPFDLSDPLRFFTGSSVGQSRENATWQDLAKPCKKPIAPTIEDFIVFPLRYQPRPEWYTTSTKRRTSFGDASTSFQESAAAAANPLADLETFGADCDSALLRCIRKSATRAALNILECCNTYLVNLENKLGVTPLILACQMGASKTCKALLEKGADPTHVTANGISAVWLAAKHGKLPCLTVILEDSKSPRLLVELANFQNGTTPLMMAAHGGYLDVVQYLMAKGAGPLRQNQAQDTALTLACQQGHAKIVQYLLQFHQPPQSQPPRALELACQGNHLAVVKVLVSAGWEVCAKNDTTNLTLLQVALAQSNLPLANLLDPTLQMHLLQVHARQERSWELWKMFKLLSSGRATPKEQLSGDRSTTALVKSLTTLPEALVKNIAEFAPLPALWEQRIQLLMKRANVHGNAALEGGLDFMDEILEEGGFLEACDQVGSKTIPAPSGFDSWVQWRGWNRRNSKAPEISSGAISSSSTPQDHLAIIPEEDSTKDHESIKDDRQTLVDVRRYTGRYLQVLSANFEPLQTILISEPYNMPMNILQEIKNAQDISSLIRRLSSGVSAMRKLAASSAGGDINETPGLPNTSCGGVGVHFDPPVAMDFIMLTSRLVGWYQRERESK